jgi:23S rRNA maturation mini-RNase III
MENLCSVDCVDEFNRIDNNSVENYSVENNSIENNSLDSFSNSEALFNTYFISFSNIVPDSLDNTDNRSYSNENDESNNNENRTTNASNHPRRGRKNRVNNKRPKHDKFSRDNIKRKIQVDYLKFLVNLINKIIDEIVYEGHNTNNIKFFPINYEFAKKVNKNSFDSLKNTTIGDIFKDNVSPRFKKYKNLNKDVYNIIIKQNQNQIIKNILDKKYLEFFKSYYLHEEKINLFKYGLNQNIILSDNMGFYKDLIEKNKTSNIIEDVKYRDKMKRCIIKDFFCKPIFIVY